MVELAPPLGAADFVRLLSTTEGRTKAYRLVQYTSKALQLTIQSLFPADGDGDGNGNADSSEAIRLLRRLEVLMGTCRKAMRLFRFIDMWLLLPTVKDKEKTIRRLRQLRILSFFGMFLFENISLFYPTTNVDVKDAQGKPSTLFTIQWSRWCHTCWFLSLCLGLGLDYTLQRSSTLGLLKNLTELPIATILTLRVRVDDWLMCALGITSSLLSVKMHWDDKTPRLLPVVKHFESAY